MRDIEKVRGVGPGWNAVELIVTDTGDLEALRGTRRDVATLIGHQDPDLFFAATIGEQPGG